MSNCPKSKLTVPLVWIEWEDSGQAIPQWQWLDNLEAPTATKCITVGFLVLDDEQVKAVAVSLGDGNDPETAQVSGVVTIPSRCIVQMERLSSPASYRRTACGPDAGSEQRPKGS